MDTNRKKRAFKRKNFNRTVEFELSAIEEGRGENIHKSAEAVNISSGGIGLRTACVLHRGEILKLNLPVISGGATLPVFSEVVWVRQAGTRVEAGLRFL